MEYKKWFEQAKEDLEKAEILFKNLKFDGASFYAPSNSRKIFEGFNS
jgi:HEPN domain-containing protein